MLLSIVSTLYRSAPTIDEFYRRAIAAGESVAEAIEIVLVNDGSPDESLTKALGLQASDPRVVVVDLARNFGHHKAMMTGLAHAQGDFIFLIDCDLEEEPEVLPTFYERMLQTECDVVYGVQEQRKGGTIERLGGDLYYGLLDWLSDQKIPRNLVTARLMKKAYVSALTSHQDREFVISYLWAITGFQQIPVVVRKLSLSPSTYSVRTRIELTVKHVTTTSTKLLYWILYLGIVIFLLAGLTIASYIARRFVTGIGVSGWTSLMVSIWFFGGLTTIILGIIGIYVANIMSETKKRPYTVVREVHRLPPSQDTRLISVVRPTSYHRTS